jgi:starch synthase (maltosyl-transferring)
LAVVGPSSRYTLRVVSSVTIVTGRIVIDDIHPRTPDAGYPAKAVIGEAVRVSAVIFKDGHDILAARAHLVSDDATVDEQVVELRPGAVDVDQWTATLVPTVIGRHQLMVQAWTDRYATWAHRVEVNLAAGQDMAVELADGRALLLGAVDPGSGRPDAVVVEAVAALDDAKLGLSARFAPALSPPVAAALAGPEHGSDVTVALPRSLWVDRELALFGSWYELFPRSHGGFKGTEERVPAVAAMGFDVLYLPPVHPIGMSHRKGANNTLVAGPDDPGSPWAIGSEEGGHTSVDPALGTIDDFRHLVEVVSAQGMEIALDYALQCSPDHPWVTEHPEWFHHRADGSIAYAENPPKKYQDIFPINFWPVRDADRVALWTTCKEVLDYWIEQGVRIFRVDNPHTKPVAFWEWIIPAVQSKHPEVLFLAEAFTRPHVMEKLAAVGFSQSYTYFTWRTEREGPEGLSAYMETLTEGPAADYFRPNFWPNTPDILSGPLRNGPPAAFALRLVLAATLSPSYGIYSGFELYENQPASSTNEEYLNSEKYEIKHRDYEGSDNLSVLVTSLNVIRRRHPALQRLRNLALHPADNPHIVAYSKMSDDGRDALLVVVTLDPLLAQDSIVHLDAEVLGLPLDRPYVVRDELSGERFVWSGEDVYVRLEPSSRVAHILDLRPEVEA